MLLAASLSAQTAERVLDKAAAVVGAKKGAQASFSMTGKKYGNQSGTIAIKGKKFCATTAQATIWYDGKTQWTYLRKNDEVNVSTPNANQQQVLNPYNFIYLYKSGYSSTITSKTADAYEVHLTATSKAKKLQELYITVSRKTYAPTKLRFRQGTDWTTIKISNFKTATLSDAAFRFNQKDYPTAEVIDLR